MNPPVRRLAALLALALVASACTGDPEPEPTESGPGVELSASVASYDLSADRAQRVMVGIPATDGRVLSFGTVEVAFAYLGETQAEGEPEPGPEATARFVAVPGEAPPGAAPAEPTLTSPSETRGVYVANDVDFERAGLWEVTVTAEVEGATLTAAGTFPVRPEPRVPAVGDPALKTRQHLPGAEGIDLVSIDSSAGETGELTDPHLHTTTVAQALNEGRPILLLLATPVYCVSRFCGPVTDVIADLATEHGDEAEFMHIEIWKDFQGQVINKAAADWILTGEGADQELQEPWLFLIGPDGRIAARWDNLFDPAEVEAELAAVAGGE